MTGKGVVGQVDGCTVAVGNAALFEALSLDSKFSAKEALTLRDRGETVMLVAIDNRPAGFISVADPVKSSTAEAIALLHKDNIRIMMLTGDNRVTAQAVARALSIDSVAAEVLPEQKAQTIKKLQAEGRIVAMAGDGVNDAPALAQAQVGIAMGTGTDVAMQSAGITLVQGDLRGIARARILSRGRCSVSGIRLGLEPHDRQRRHDVQFSIRHPQRAAIAPSETLKFDLLSTIK
jgi:Cu+-exporting ATPase